MLGGLRSCLGVALMLDLCLGFSLRPLMLHRSSQRESSFVRGTGGPRSLTCQASQSATKSTQVWNGVGELADRYDAFLIDQWGVMHDGKTAYGGAVECMKQLQGLGKKIILLSNSSRRKGNSLKKIDGMGFHSTSILDLITSGEVGWQCLSERPAGTPFESLGSKVYVFGNGEEDDEYVKSAGLEFADVEEADFILARGLFTMQGSSDVLHREGPQKYEAWDMEARSCLQIAANRLLPMVVTNPDFVRPDGNDSPMPGKLAAMYESMLMGQLCAARKVIYVGKPHSLVYDQAFERLKEESGDIDKARVCAIGDSILHDIAGAHRTGIDSIFIADGIHADFLGLQQGIPGQTLDQTDIERLSKGLMAIPPTHTVPHFQW
uniref:Uncharacterized protein n=1 Tax=Hanusia phi TaxID=3032 RepID=A0A7S0EEY8_9CRYP|mmetsp:Transcript_22933/g.51646  ORF Transcript_22933/g.51646 Transcript_22933/m.51646 type:complete len:378 (+) Transcript_22933:14-1147(+)